jgi:cation diffusion facilitator family transporter
MDASSRTASRAAAVSILVAGTFATLKIVIGLSAHSVAVVSDGLESAGDLVTSFLVWLGLWVASKPADADHPYGHGRFETLTGLAVGIILLAVGGGICVTSLEHYVQHRTDPRTPELFAIWPVLGALAVKTALASWKFRVGKRTGSAGLTADAKHDMGDLLSSGVALTAVLLSYFVPGRMQAADQYGGMIIGVVVIFMGIEVIRETVLQLSDVMPDSDQMDQVRRIAMSVPGALAVEKCFARKTGLRYHVDLHLEVDPHMSVSDSHELAHQVKLAVMSELDWVQDVLIHVEPHLSATEIRARPALQLKTKTSHGKS